MEVGGQYEVGEEEGNHILARRPRLNEKFDFQGSDSRRFVCEIIGVSKKHVSVRALKETAVPPEPTIEVTLFQSVISEQSLDFVLQKSTELGVQKVVLFNSQRTAARLSQEKFEKKSSRWNKILWEAAKQSGRVRPPVVGYLGNLDEVISSSSRLNKLFVFDISGSKLNTKYHPQKSVGLLVGPEGGLAEAEINTLSALPNTEVITLGPLILRAETAALAAVSAIMAKVV